MLHIQRLLRLSDRDFSELQPYVFAPSNAPISPIPPSADTLLACPFPFFSVEVDQKPLTSDATGINIQCLCCQEEAPGSYIFEALVSSPLGERLIRASSTENAEVYGSFLDLANSMLSRLHNRETKLGLFNAPGHVKYKTRDGRKAKKQFHDLIYVGYKASPDTGGAPSKSPRSIAWQHSWQVQSHWRRIRGIGLDRQGERCVDGFTWVSTYLKGQGELKNKVRKVR